MDDQSGQGPKTDLPPMKRQKRPRRSGPVTREDLIEDLRYTVDRLEQDKAARGDLKILSRALRELRFGFRVFSKYRHHKKVTVFGSARTKPEEAAYQHSAKFGKMMAEAGWFVLTGAGGGIMEGAHVGAGREMSMGVNILLPFEQKANHIIDGDPKLVNLRYFFTRKLLFVKEVHAVVLFPGGLGTQDEGFETLTLIQTGKSDMVPIVCVDEPGGTYWQNWRNYIEGPAALRTDVTLTLPSNVWRTSSDLSCLCEIRSILGAVAVRTASDSGEKMLASSCSHR